MTAMIKNPQLEGGPFLWKGGNIGIVLIHGFTATTAEVRLLAQNLYRDNYTISAPLLSGHNTTPLDLNSVSWRDWVNDAEEGFQKLLPLCSHIFVGGESTGGLLALELASRHPEVLGVLTYSPALKLYMSKFDMFKLHLFSHFIPYVSKPTNDDHLAWKGYTVNPLKGVIQLINLQNIVQDHLSLIKQPTLIVQGRLDETVDPHVPGIIANQISSNYVEIHWMANSTHCVILDKELNDVTRATQEFLTKALQDNQLI